jgi:FKBP-type peptidyl-prolyl cis-trans isomerase (trigger factor)
MKKIFALMLGTMIISMSAFSAYASEEAASVDGIEFSEDGEVVMGDYSTITLNQELIDVSDDTVNGYIDTMSTDLAAAYSDIYPEAPQITDDIIAEYSEMYFGTQLDTVDAAKAFIKETLYSQSYRAAFFTELLSLAEIVSYPQAEYEMTTEYAENEIAYYAAAASLTEDEMAQKSGFESAADFVSQEAKSLVANALIFDKILDDLGIECTQEEIDAALADYMVEQGLGTADELEAFKESAGETWMWLFTETQYKAGVVFDALQDRVVVE